MGTNWFRGIQSAVATQRPFPPPRQSSIGNLSRLGVGCGWSTLIIEESMWCYQTTVHFTRGIEGVSGVSIVGLPSGFAARKQLVFGVSKTMTC